MSGHELRRKLKLKNSENRNDTGKQETLFFWLYYACVDACVHACVHAWHFASVLCLCVRARTGERRYARIYRNQLTNKELSSYLLGRSLLRESY